MIADDEKDIRRYDVYKGKDDKNTEALVLDDIVIDLNNKMMIKNGERIHLTKKEFALLCFLIRNRGKAWSLAELYENVWNEKYLTSSSNTVMVHILRLRKKIEENPAHPEIIKTIYGKGYEIF